MSSPISKSDEILDGWIYEYARSLMWNLLKDHNSTSTVSEDDDFIRGVIMKAQLKSHHSLDVLLMKWMYLVFFGHNISGNDCEQLTPLEEAINILPLMEQKLKTLNKKEVSEMELLLKEQAVLLFIRKRQFDLAKIVKNRTWHGVVKESEKTINDQLDKMIQTRSFALSRVASYFSDLLETAKRLLEDVCENQLLSPRLVKMADGEAQKQAANGVHSAKELSGRPAIQTGIQLTGFLLTAFIRKCNLKPVEGIGFVSSDEFQSAVDNIHKQKDLILQRIPAFLLPPHDGCITKVVSLPSASEKHSSSSLKRKSREENREEKMVNKQSRPALTRKSPEQNVREETANKQSTQALTNTSRRSSDSEDWFNVSLVKRVSKSSERPLFRDIRPLARMSPFAEPSPVSSAAPSLARKARTKWTAEEERNLYRAVKKFGVGNWAKIVHSNCLPGRSNIDVKDKWRSLIKKGRAEELETELDTSSVES